MKKIYVVMVELPTFINKVVYFITNFKYNHFSISFDDNLDTLYSFQIKNANTILVGGFLKEKEAYYLRENKNLKLNEFVYEIPVSDIEYDKIKNFIINIEKDNEYIFNYISALFMFSLGGIKGYKTFHCTEFVAEVLSFINDVTLPRKPYLMKPKDLYDILNNYNCVKKTISSDDYDISDNDIFFRKIKKFISIKKICYSIRESFCRVLFNRASKKYNYKMVNFYDCDFKKR